MSETANVMDYQKTEKRKTGLKVIFQIYFQKKLMVSVADGFKRRKVKGRVVGIFLR